MSQMGGYIFSFFIQLLTGRLLFVKNVIWKLNLFFVNKNKPEEDGSEVGDEDYINSNLE